MIASPCRKCPLKDQPKDECIGGCKMLASVQEHAVELSNDINSRKDCNDAEYSILTDTMAGFRGYLSTVDM